MSLTQAVSAVAAALAVAAGGSLDAGSGIVTGIESGAGSAVPGSTAVPAPIPPCPGPAPRVTPFGDPPPPVLGWTENLAADAAGLMWATKTFLDRVDAYDSTGRVVASVPVHAPGGIALGPDGRMHVATGTGYLAFRSDVVSFDPAEAAVPGARIATRFEARLDSRKNGLAVDAAGNRYLTGLEDAGLTKVRPDGTVDHEWSRAAAIGGANGIAIEGDTAYVSQSTTTETLLLTVPLDRPEDTTRTVLTAPPVRPRGLDDLALTADAIYLTSWTTGEVYRIDRASGEACVVVAGIPRATSVWVTEGFGPTDGPGLLVTSLHGRIRHVATGA